MARPFWELNGAQLMLLQRAIWRRPVVDVGAGEYPLAFECSKLGASRVIALDSKYNPYTEKYRGWLAAGVYVGATFDELSLLPDQVAVVSWPEPYAHKARQVLRLVERCETVVYVGKNDEFTACATPEFFLELEKRLGEPVQAVAKQDMSVYGRLGV